MNSQEKHLYYLNELSDYKVDGRYADVRGWNVRDATLRTMGTVKNLLVNKTMERVVYLDVEVDASIIDAKHDPYGQPADSEIREFINEKGENHIIVPIGLVDINREDEYVYTELIDRKTFAETKRIRRDAPIYRDYEKAVLDSYGRRYAYTPEEKSTDADIEGSDVYREERLEKIKQRHDVGKYRNSETDPRNIEDEAEQYFDKNKSPESPKNSIKDEKFYGRSEFDDSRFYRDKK